jgi:hypothetical protein
LRATCIHPTWGVNAKRLWYFCFGLFLNVLAFVHISKASNGIEYLQTKQYIQKLFVRKFETEISIMETSNLKKVQVEIMETI